jgi:ABC-type transport system involved in cytochrome c biogenesis permease subunit
VTETLAVMSNRLVLSAVAAFALALLLAAAQVARASRTAASTAGGARREAAERTARAHGSTAVLDRPAEPPRAARLLAAERPMAVLATGLLAAAVVARGLATGRPPWGNMYEFATACALAAAVGLLVAARAGHAPAGLRVWVHGLVLSALGLAVTVLYTPGDDLVPALDSYWLVVHVAAAIVSAGAFTIAAGASVLHQVRLRRDPVGAEVAGRLAHTVTVFAFPIWTFAVVAGAIWAEEAWGRYWGWDPKETWAFITWVLYAVYLHAEATPGYRGRRAHWFALAGYVALVFNFFGVNMWITGLHSYAGV